MKKYSLVYTILAFMAFGIFFANQVSAASNTLNFQSKIVNVSDGTNVTTGTPACVVAGSGNDTCDFRVNIYSASSAGTLYFSETHSNVEIGQYNGIFNLAINSVCASTSTAGTDGNWTAGGCVSNGGVDFSSSSLWIEIAFAPGGAGSFTETFSRVQIKDVASARYATSSSYLGGLAAADFVQFKPGSAQSTTSTNTLINLTSTATAATAPLVNINENGTGTPDLLRLQTAGSTVFGVSNTGSLTMIGDLVNTSTGTVGLFNTNVTTLNIGGSATTLNLAGGSASTGCTINSAGDIACSGDITATGGDLITTATTAAVFNTGATTAVNIAGAAATTNIGGTTVNLAGGVGSTGCTIDSAGSLTCTGGIAATIAADSLDYIDFEDTMDLDTNLTLNQATSAWTQNFTGTSTAGYVYNANSLTNGAGIYLSSTATAFTGNLQRIILSGNNAANTGNLLELSILGASSAATGLKINNVGTGPAIWSTAGDNRFDGNLTTGETTISVFNTTATTVNFAGAATTLALAGGSGSTGCTINSAGDIACSGDVTATGGDLITTATTAAVFNTGATVAVNIAGAAATTNVGGTTVNLAGGSGSTGCTIDSSGNLTCTGTIGGGGSFFSQGGNSFGATAVLGTNDSNMLEIETAGTTRIRVDTDGYVSTSPDGTALTSFAAGHIYTGTTAASIVSQYSSLTIANGSASGAGTAHESYATHASNTNTISITGGRFAAAKNSGTGTVGALYGLTTQIIAENGGAATVGYGLRVLSATDTGTSSIATNYGIYIDTQSVGTSADYGLYITGADTYALWSDTGENRFDGALVTGSTSLDVFNTTATTINFGGAATTLNIGPGSTTATNVNIAGGSGATGCTVAGATGNLTCSGTISGTFSMAADSLDYIDFQDTLDLDNHLTYNQSSFIVTQNFTGSTTVGTTYNVNSLTSGTGFAVISSSTGLTTGGSIATIGLTGSNAANIGDVLEIFQTGTLSGAKVINMSNYGTGDSIRIDDVSGDTTPFIIDASGNVSVGGNINTSLTSIDVVNTTATTVNFAGAATTLALAGGSGSTGCTINSSGDITCTGDVTATGGDLITTSTTAALFNTGATTLSIGGAATTFNIGPAGATATTLLFAGGSGATGCTLTGADGWLTCTGRFTGDSVVANTTLTTGGTFTASGVNNFGNGANDYTPTTINWNTNGGTTLLLNALNYSALGFHDSGLRVDFIRTGAGVMTLGYDGGWGNAEISMPGQVTIGTGSPSLTSTLTARQNTVGDPVMHIINTGNAGGAQGLHVQGCQNTPTTACNLIILYDGDGTQAGRIQVSNGGGSAYQTTSDLRAKKNIADTAYSLEDLLNVRVRDYEYLDSNVRRTGYVAQELYNVFPGAVGVTEDPNEMWAVDYGAMTPLIVQGVQDLNDIVEGNTRTIADLQVRDTELLALINGLTTRVAGLETRVATLEGAQSGSGAAVDLVNFMATNGSFSGNLTVAGNTNINGKVYFGNENVGEAKILAGDTEVTIVFDTAFETMPIVQVTPQSDNFLTLPVKYVVSEKTVNKFKIKIDVAQLEDLVFNWSVSGTRDGVQIDSDGNVANL